MTYSIINHARIFSAITMTVMLMSVEVQAKRRAPAVVAPIIAGGAMFYYERAPDRANDPGENYSMNLICKNTLNDQTSWKTKIYEVKIDPNLESDVQDIYLKSLIQKDGIVVAVDERGQEYRVNAQSG